MASTTSDARDWWKAGYRRCSDERAAGRHSARATSSKWPSSIQRWMEGMSIGLRVATPTSVRQKVFLAQLMFILAVSPFGRLLVRRLCCAFPDRHKGSAMTCYGPGKPWRAAQGRWWPTRLDQLRSYFNRSVGGARNRGRNAHRYVECVWMGLSRPGCWSCGCRTAFAQGRAAALSARDSVLP